MLLIVIIYLVYNKYVKDAHVPKADHLVTGFQNVLANKFYVDEFYNTFITKPLNVLSSFSYNWIEKGFIDRIVNSFGYLTNGASGVLRLVQSGHIGLYIIAMVIAVILMFVFKMII